MGLWYYLIQEEVRDQISQILELLWWTIVVMEMRFSPPSAGLSKPVYIPEKYFSAAGVFFIVVKQTCMLEVLA